MKNYLLFSAILLILIGACAAVWVRNTRPSDTPQSSGIRFVALGDSFTIGEGATDSWPNMLLRHHLRDGIPVSMPARPSVSGATTADAIIYEIPRLPRANPTFATLLIGVNDAAEGSSAAVFRKNLSSLIDGIQANLADPRNLILMTIPDVSVTPWGKGFDDPAELRQRIIRYNEAIVQLARQEGLPVVDIFPVSQAVERNPDLVVEDGFHPSAKGYEAWEPLIYAKTIRLLKDRKLIP